MSTFLAFCFKNSPSECMCLGGMEDWNGLRDELAEGLGLLRAGGRQAG